MSDASTPAVSVVLTVFNKRPWLPATLDSLRTQAGPRAEIVCVDDASTDGSRAWLEAEAGRDPHLRVIGEGPNRGPAIRLNQGAAAARGRWLHLIDADDLAAPNAQVWMLARLAEGGATLLYGRRRPGEAAAPIPEDTPITAVASPLAFCAMRPVAHMALMVERGLFLAAGGADPAVFIQDQSLPLRLAAQGPRMLWTEATLCVAPARGLSANRAQQNHDRFLSTLNLLEALPDGAEGTRALRSLGAAALFKLDRATGRPDLPTALAYGAAKLGRPPSRRWLAAQRGRAMAVAGIRRAEAPA